MRLLRIIVWLGLMLLAVPATAQDFEWQDAFKKANVAYNAEDYESAVELYVKAIQASPRKAASYRNLARTYFWLDRYAEAVVNYDHYLTLAATAEDFDQVKSERRLASDRAGDAVWTLPEPQRLTRTTLNKVLDEGAALTEGGGGAWGLYQTLLRTGYAEPNLALIRARLARRLLEEFEAGLVTSSSQPVPLLDLSQWQIQMERLTHARSVVLDPAARDIVDRRAAIAETALALLTGQAGNAAELAKSARQANPDYVFVRWFEVAALIETDKLDAASKALAELREDISDDAAAVAYARVVEAEIARREGEMKSASETLWKAMQ